MELVRVDAAERRVSVDERSVSSEVSTNGYPTGASSKIQEDRVQNPFSPAGFDRFVDKIRAALQAENDKPSG